MPVFWKTIFKTFLFIFAFIGLGFTVVFLGMRMGIFNVRGSIQERNEFFENTETTVATCMDDSRSCDWMKTPEWTAIKGGLEKDAEIILRVSRETGVSPRMIVAAVVPEQTRFFTSNREIFKSYFEPMKVLGSLTKFSLGISGIKQETANEIEKYAQDPNSVFYPGREMAELFAYAEGENRSNVLYARLTDAKDHYYQYLYTALYIKEIEAHWANEGYDISQNSGVVVTLFNLGFRASKPKSNPIVAGAPITTGGKVYTYGALGAAFYDSNELRGIFPR
ncbi:MAG: hypothetical protein KA052_01180 [Candidatus Pacebacteria bacterium]|nr:hypothetical protein [Candidatus Paceibacterota bacterium]